MGAFRDLIDRAAPRWLTVAAAIALASCASLREPVPVGAVPQAAEVPRVWRLEGRIGVKIDDKGWNASLQWSQRGEDFSARFSGPFGRGMVEIRQLDGALWVRDPEGREHREPDLQQWARDQFGAELPVRELPYWLVGAPDPGLAAGVSRDDAGRPSSLEQAGWQVRFQDWTAWGPWVVPRRLVLSRADVEVKVVVDRWTEGDGSQRRG